VAKDPWQRREAALADNVRQARERLGLTQEALAHAAGISRNHVQLLERGRGAGANPRLRTLYGLAEALGVRVIDLLPTDAR
jgi:transcriptional regulator with XRE-family HTH domain